MTDYQRGLLRAATKHSENGLTSEMVRAHYPNTQHQPEECELCAAVFEIAEDAIRAEAEKAVEKKQIDPDRLIAGLRQSFKGIGRGRRIKLMVDRFLSWPLPKTFSPDCGISFDGRGKDAAGYEKQWPIGTNLFSADEATQMFEHCFDTSAALESAPSAPAEALIEEIANTAHSRWIYGQEKFVVNAAAWAIREYLKRREWK